jgi:glycosyltransferase involved in cell wall biosynthesis
VTGTNQAGRRHPLISVLMPTHNQAALIGRALESLLAQTFSAWELVIVDDGSTDQTYTVVQSYLADERIQFHRLEENQGLGAALNRALHWATAPLIAYLPSDDIYFRDHLASLVAAFDAHPEAVLVYSGIRHEHRVPGQPPLETSSPGQLEGYPLQLVQVMHRRTGDRWMERGELVTDDLERMFWHKLRLEGAFVGTGSITCEWVEHPEQLHKVIQEPIGGINPYRSRFQVKQPLRFHATTGHYLDEIEHYRRFRERPDTPPASDGLKILLVGELAFNPERVLALEERGHRLYGLWTTNLRWFNTVGPLPFGHVVDLPRTGWRDAIKRLQPDMIYALLNWNAVPFAHEVLTACPGIPFVWHFKESPFDCIANGTWPLLLDLYTRSGGQIYLNAEMRDWFAAISPGIVKNGRPFLLDGDLPRREWFTEDWSPRLSKSDGRIHTVIPGGPTGIAPSLVGELAALDIHVHLYGEFYQDWYRSWVEEAQRRAPHHLHLHPQVEQERWVSEFSKYDAGWLHQFTSDNQGDLHKANWSDLNLAARIPTLAAAGVPMILHDNTGSTVAAESLARALDIGIFYRNAAQLGAQLHDQERIARLRQNLRRQREQFTFDYHADTLIEFFREVIAARA